MYEITPQNQYFVGIDSDGCAFDTMELKHKECFIPNTINYYNLQAVSKYAREAAEFVNLYSKSRGINRFPALIETLQWRQKRPEVRNRGVHIEIPQSLQKWIREETKLGNPALETKVRETGDRELEQCLVWSLAVNETVARIVRGVPPFPYVRESLQKLQGRADVVVVSATPNEALHKEWQEHDIDQYVAAICGQEIGTKKELLTNASKYASVQTLMIGDAPGDFQAAQANRCLFFPINPGAEEASWQRFFEEGVDRFLQGKFAGDYQQALLIEFEKYLPETPPWPVIG
ncbi:MAG: HAD hydrolase-like protein [Planctomycetes bacterium]|nr:HAD hydrolase-like protein [Planctomycetota bacterium]